LKEFGEPGNPSRRLSPREQGERERPNPSKTDPDKTVEMERNGV